MFSFNEHEKEQINKGVKVSTLRPIKESGKGYFKIGSLQMFCLGRDFVNGFFNRGLILNRYPVNIEDLTAEDFQAVGYSSKAEYMSQPYNQNNPSQERMKYDFITLTDLADIMAGLEIDPDNFRYMWDIVKGCKELTAGVNPDLIFEGCDCEDLESEFSTLESNIQGALL